MTDSQEAGADRKARAVFIGRYPVLLNLLCCDVGLVSAGSAERPSWQRASVGVPASGFMLTTGWRCSNSRNRVLFGNRTQN